MLWFAEQRIRQANNFFLNFSFKKHYHQFVQLNLIRYIRKIGPVQHILLCFVLTVSRTVMVNFDIISLRTSQSD